jgi:hypothetical protein
VPQVDLPLRGASWKLQAAVCAVASAVLGYALAQGHTAFIAIVAIVLGLGGGLFAIVRPRWLFAVAIATLVFVPTYASPAVGPFLLFPAVISLWILAGGLVWRRMVIDQAPLRMAPTDVAVLVFMGLMAISVGFSDQPELGDYLHHAFPWMGAYLGARMFMRESRAPELLALSFAIATAAMLPFAVVEATTGANPFLSLALNQSEADVWASVGGDAVTRFGETRIEVAFGHPIALSMFFASSALLSLNMAIHTDRLGNRALWFSAAALGAIEQALTVSRSGWVLLAFGIVGLMLTAGRGAARRRLTWILAGLVVLAAAAAQLGPPDQLRTLPGTDSVVGSAAAAESSDYRMRLLERALEPGVLHAWGNPANAVAPAVSAANFATDNQYIIFGDMWGLIPLAAFLLVVLSLVHTLARALASGEGLLAGIPLVALANCAGLFLVALITQQQVMVWLLIGASAATAERLAVRPVRRRNRRSPLAPARRGGPAVGGLPLPSR